MVEDQSVILSDHVALQTLCLTAEEHLSGKMYHSHCAAQPSLSLLNLLVKSLRRMKFQCNLFKWCIPEVMETRMMSRMLCTTATVDIAGTGWKICRRLLQPCHGLMDTTGDGEESALSGLIWFNDDVMVSLEF